jgi:hypothetical protein
VAGYSAFRIVEELLRVDPAHHLFGLRLNLYVAASLTIAGLAWFARSQRLRLPRLRPTKLVPAAVGIGRAAGIPFGLCWARWRCAHARPPTPSPTTTMLMRRARGAL